jgi:hypothetical protein
MNPTEAFMMPGTCDGCGESLCPTHHVCHACSEGEASFTPDKPITEQVEEFSKLVVAAQRVHASLTSTPEVNWQAFIPGGPALHKAWRADITKLAGTLNRAIRDGAPGETGTRVLTVALSLTELNLSAKQVTLNGKPVVGVRIRGPIRAVEYVILAVVAAQQTAPRSKYLQRVLGALMRLYVNGAGQDIYPPMKPHLMHAQAFPEGTAELHMRAGDPEGEG